MRFEVLLTGGAEHDLEQLYDCVSENDSPANADRLLDRLMKVVESLATLPERGVHPRELLALGIHEYRQVFFKPYRVIYRIVAKNVFVYVIADGRRDMQSLLELRLLGG
jgi:toxin ParE1/3/4